MALTVDQFHTDLEYAQRRGARRALLVATVQTVVLLSLVLWAIYSTLRVAHDLEAAREVQKVTAAQNELQTRLLCQMATLEGQAPLECAPYAAIDTTPPGDPNAELPPPGYVPTPLPTEDVAPPSPTASADVQPVVGVGTGVGILLSP